MSDRVVLTPLGPEASDEECGYTLIELVLTVALLGIISGALVSSFLVMLSTKDQTSKSLDASRNQQFLATYFTDDVAGLRSVASGSQLVCGSTQNTLVVFNGLDFSPSTNAAVGTAPIATTVAWVYRPFTSELARVACRGGSAADTRVLARNLPSSPTVSASCSGAATVSGSPAEMKMTVPNTSGGVTALCGKRRSSDTSLQAS